ncbi:membrane protein BRI3 [Stomoxys calcitrans]|uniref:Membrane protein BRI3 n=1 Tax=Stomoxys calcitrans TaxID=35570 RepID=A0A1I8NMW8_STOCA|nr:membrane protein BRI3 [Stomoxys calcitrans]
MSQPPAKEVLPPSYEEVMNTSADTTPTPQQGTKYPNPNVGVTEGANQPPQQYYVPQAPPNQQYSAGPFYPASAPQPGYQVPSYGAFESTPVSVVIQPPTLLETPNIIVVGGCPACRIGILEDSYPLCGLLCALVFFPVGILCCLAMKNKRCTNCGTEF